MSCIFDKSRPCGSKTRAKNRYTRDELENMAKDYGIENYKTKTMDTLCSEIGGHAPYPTPSGHPSGAAQKGKSVKSKSPKSVKGKSPKGKSIQSKTCNFDATRPCGSKAKGKNKYSRAELEKVALSCGLKGVKSKTMDVLCKSISMKLGVKPISAKPISPKKKVEKNNATCHDMIKKFIDKYKDELIGWISEKDKPQYKLFVAGGYGIKTVLEDKYHVHGKIKTKDLDLTVSNHDSKMSINKCFEFWVKKMNEFFAENGKKSFKMKTVYLGKSWVPGFKYYRYYLINTSYNGVDFIDLAIGDIQITKSMMDVPLSKQVGLPIKTEACYLKEFLTLVYMENVPGVSGHAYGKRNPVTGQYAAKGQKDINNSKLLCNYVTKGDNVPNEGVSPGKKQKYKKYCKLLAEITIDELVKMKKADRDKYFGMLSEIV